MSRHEAIPQVSVTHWTIVRLHIAPQIVIRELEGLRQQLKQTPIYGIGKILLSAISIDNFSSAFTTYVRKCSNLAHEWLDALWNSILLVLELSSVKVELLNAWQRRADS